MWQSILQWLINFFYGIIGRKPTPPSPNPPQPKPIPPPQPKPVPPPPPSPTDVTRKQLLDLHNQQRAKHGSPPLKLNDKLNSSAQKHNDWMVAHNRLSHNEGWVGVGQRITNEGYKWQTCGENIAEGYLTPDSVVNAWMSDFGHRRNILDSSFKDVGFGIGKTNDGTWYWTTDFGATF